jgi:ketosteroid isomerase-like protein
MSRESETMDLVDLQRRAFEAGSRRDLDMAMSFYGPDSVWDTTPMGMGVYQGLSAIRRFFEDWMNAYEDFEMEPEELLDLGNGVGFGVARQSGTPVGSTGRVEMRYAQVVVARDGLVVRLTSYTDIDEARAAAQRAALEAVGLRE